jgi:hypothetical protein
VNAQGQSFCCNWYSKTARLTACRAWHCIGAEAEYERRPDGTGSREDPPITFVEPLGRYVMTHTTFSPNGPRIALAVSEDLLQWERIGLASWSALPLGAMGQLRATSSRTSKTHLSHLRSPSPASSRSP